MSKDSKQRSRKSALSNGPQTVHSYRLTVSAPVQASAAGTVLVVTTVDPTSFTEYADLSALYSEIRIKRARYHLSYRHQGSASSGGVEISRGGVAVAFNPANTATAPTSIAASWAVAGAKLVSGKITDTVIVEAKIPSMGWASTAAPIPGPYAGCYGAFELASNVGAFEANDSVFTGLLECEYEVRGRR